ncbi:hypothetical protein KY284_022809 [Solanum tuberosum]|nr:hypothetical protein KY284_022809 [Solanum tuberosum]
MVSAENGSAGGCNKLRSGCFHMRHSKFSRMPWKPSPLNTLHPNMNNSCPFLQIEPEILLIPLHSPGGGGGGGRPRVREGEARGPGVCVWGLRGTAPRGPWGGGLGVSGHGASRSGGVGGGASGDCASEVHRGGGGFRARRLDVRGGWGTRETAPRVPWGWGQERRLEFREGGVEGSGHGASSFVRVGWRGQDTAP